MLGSMVPVVVHFFGLKLKCEGLLKVIQACFILIEESSVTVKEITYLD